MPEVPTHICSSCGERITYGLHEVRMVPMRRSQRDALDSLSRSVSRSAREWPAGVVTAWDAASPGATLTSLDAIIAKALVYVTNARNDRIRAARIEAGEFDDSRPYDRRAVASDFACEIEAVTDALLAEGRIETYGIPNIPVLVIPLDDEPVVSPRPNQQASDDTGGPAPWRAGMMAPLMPEDAPEQRPARRRRK